MLDWIDWKRSKSCLEDGCIEVARVGDMILMRDSKHPDNVHEFTSEEWSAFVQGVENGEFRF